MNFRKRFRLFLNVIATVAVLILVKAAIHESGFEFLTLNALVPSIVAGAIFIIGFLLSNIFSDFKEAERMPAEMRMALEAIHDDVVSFAKRTPNVDVEGLRRTLLAIVTSLEEGLGSKVGHSDLGGAIAQVEKLSSAFSALEGLGMSPNYMVRLRSEQDVLRRLLYRIHYMQKMEFVPSVHVLVQTLVAATILMLLFLKSEGSLEAAIVFGFVSYMFIYALYLVETFDKPFRKGEKSVDDVSIFLLRDFARKLERPNGEA